MNRTRGRNAHVLFWTIVLIAGAAVGSRMVWVHLHGGAFVPMTIASTYDGEEHTRSILVRAGLSSSVLAAAGIPANGVACIVSAAASSASQQAATINAADESVRTSRQTVDHLTRVVQSGAATEQQISQLASARTALASAQASRDAALDTVFAAASAVMSESQRRIATNVRTNRGWGLPIHHLAAQNVTEAGWVTLRDAIGCNETCTRKGEEVPASATAIISESESITDVASAQSSHASNAGTVATAWNQAVTGG